MAPDVLVRSSIITCVLRCSRCAVELPGYGIASIDLFLCILEEPNQKSAHSVELGVMLALQLPIDFECSGQLVRYFVRNLTRSPRVVDLSLIAPNSPRLAIPRYLRPMRIQGALKRANSRRAGQSSAGHFIEGQLDQHEVAVAQAGQHVREA